MGLDCGSLEIQMRGHPVRHCVCVLLFEAVTNDRQLQFQTFHMAQPPGYGTTFRLSTLNF